MTDSEADREPAGEESDDALIALASRGSQDAFGQLVRRYQRLVFRIGGGFFREPAEVEDIAQEAFLRAFQSIHRFRIGSPFAPWIGRIALHLCYDRLRRRRSRQDVSWQDLGPGEQETVRRLSGWLPADEGAATRDLAERLLERLSVRDRQALVLVDALGYTPAEAARLIGASGIVLRVRLHRARRRVQGLAAELVREGAQGAPRGPGVPGTPAGDAQ